MGEQAPPRAWPWRPGRRHMAATASGNTQRGCTGRKVTAVPTHPAPPWPSNLLSAFLGSPSLLCGGPAPLEDLVPVRERPAGQLLHGLLPLPLNRPCRLHGPHPQACLLGPPGGSSAGAPWIRAGDPMQPGRVTLGTIVTCQVGSANCRWAPAVCQSLCSVLGHAVDQTWGGDGEQVGR